MRIDYEAAFADLTRWIVEAESVSGQPKTGFSRRELNEKVVELMARHQVSESLIERAARIFGLPLLVEHARAVLTNAPETEAPAAPPEASASKPDDPGPYDDRGGHDGDDSRSAESRLAGAGTPT